MKYHNYTLRSKPWRRKKSYKTLTVTRHQEDNSNKATSFFTLTNQDNLKTRMATKYCITKTKQTQNIHKNRHINKQ